MDSAVVDLNLTVTLAVHILSTVLIKTEMPKIQRFLKLIYIFGKG